MQLLKCTKSLNINILRYKWMKILENSDTNFYLKKNYKLCKNYENFRFEITGQGDTCLQWHVNPISDRIYNRHSGVNFSLDLREKFF